jgi:hypothetical protein
VTLVKGIEVFLKAVVINKSMGCADRQSAEEYFATDNWKKVLMFVQKGDAFKKSEKKVGDKKAEVANCSFVCCALHMVTRDVLLLSNEL